VRRHGCKEDESIQVHSLSINSSGVGGSGFKPFLFLVSPTNVLEIDCGTACHVLK
jgi:hypothetical protein